MWFHKTPTPEAAPIQLTPIEKLNALVEAEKKKLHDAQLAATKSQELVRTKERERAPLAQDIATLEHRLAQPEHAGDAALLAKLQSKKNEIAEIDAQLAEVAGLEKKAAQALVAYDTAISEIKNQASTLNVTLDVAHADNARANFQSSVGHGELSDALSDLKQQIRDANASTQTADAMNNPVQSGMDQEFLNAAK
jgi:chromosome segregation ATPase